LTIRLFADDCIIYRKNTNKKTQKSCRRIWTPWRNVMEINPSKSTAIRFMTAQVKNPLGYSPSNQKILEASSCKYLRIIL